jgi:23S rRNA (cytidine1920-2'-O)/16S rRNA (cytidine1409-2'-O)-methyltransferase
MNTSQNKCRLDRLLVSRGLAKSRHQAQGVILARQVLVDGQVAQKTGQLVSQEAQITLKSPPPYVSRGGIKLESAIKQFSIAIENKVALDIGASTGGFTDCLLQHGASKVYAVDVGYGQLAWELRQDPRVKVLDRTNARYLKFTDLGEPVAVVTIDVSFISLTKILPQLIPLLIPTADVIALAKPQFEVGRGEVGRNGVIREPEKHRQVLTKLIMFAQEIDFHIGGISRSPILGAKGNVEFLLYLTIGRTLPRLDISWLIEKLVDNKADN